MIPAAGGEGSAIPKPEKKKREKKPPKARRNPNVAIRLVVTPEGTFKPVDEASRQICRSRKFYAGIELLGYMYQMRSSENWAKAHGLGQALVEHVEAFHGLNAHTALKKLQEDGRIAVSVEKVEIKGIGFLERVVADSLAFDEIDEGEFQEIYGRMVEYARVTYWPQLDEAGMQGLQRLLGVGS